MSADRASGADLAVEDLVVRYGTAAAIRGVDLRVEEGEIVGIIGPNGAGKTTLCETFTGFKEYAAGSVRFRGREVADQETADLVKEGLNYCTERRDLFGFMSAADNLELGAYHGADEIDARLEFVYGLFPRLEERAEQPAHTLSGGEQQMLALGRALMAAPEFLILDEPTLGLAPVIVQDISATIEEIAGDATILLTEQNVTFAMDHADRVYLLENGEVTREGKPETLAADEYVTEAYIG